MALTNEQVLQELSNKFGEAVKSSSEPYGLLTVEISSDRNVPVIQWLKDESGMNFGFLTDLCAVHYPHDTGRELAVVYHLHSLQHNFRLRLKCYIPESDPQISTLTGVFSGANWMERETFDFYGINFTGHPDLRRILNMDSMDYHPMRKQYALEDETREDKQDRFFGR